MSWRDPADRVGPGRVAPASSGDSGIVWFFSPANWEMLVKVLDGCSLNGHYWVYAAATTDVAYTLAVTDTLHRIRWERANPPATAARAITDTAAFATCP